MLTQGEVDLGRGDAVGGAEPGIDAAVDEMRAQFGMGDAVDDGGMDAALEDELAA